MIFNIFLRDYVCLQKFLKYSPNGPSIFSRCNKIWKYCCSIVIDHRVLSETPCILAVWATPLSFFIRLWNLSRKDKFFWSLFPIHFCYVLLLHSFISNRLYRMSRNFHTNHLFRLFLLIKYNLQYYAMIKPTLWTIPTFFRDDSRKVFDCFSKFLKLWFF